jgi:hypothetical protein
MTTVHTTYLCARVGCPLLLTSTHKQMVLQGFKYPLRKFLISSNFTRLNFNVTVPRAYTSVATIHTTYLCARIGCPLLLTNTHKQIVLQVLLTNIFRIHLSRFLLNIKRSRHKKRFPKLVNHLRLKSFTINAVKWSCSRNLRAYIIIFGTL